MYPNSWIMPTVDDLIRFQLWILFQTIFQVIEGRWDFNHNIYELWKCAVGLSGFENYFVPTLLYFSFI